MEMGTLLGRDAVVAGLDVRRHVDDALAKQLRRLSTHGSSLGAVCTGSYVLAKAGLLDGYRCTIHWENMSSFAEEFPEVELSKLLYVVDHGLFTCAGGRIRVKDSYRKIRTPPG